MSKERNIAIFEDTMKIATERKLKPISTKHTTSEIIIPPKSNTYNVEVLPLDSVSTLKEMVGKTCLLNMASAKKNGGGVLNGLAAQEESLCRCSDLYLSLKPEYYPLQKNEIIYSKGVTFFKDFHYNLMNEIKCDVISAAAYNFNGNARYDDLSSIFNNYYSKETKNNHNEEEYKLEMMNKMRLMFVMAYRNGCKNMILSSWGCGVFKNNPNNVAGMFKEVINEGYGNLFERIVFGIINDHNSDNDNYNIFKEILGK